jgi:NADH-quinone oxidoreductase subunit G
MATNATLTIDGREVEMGTEKNLLELIRRVGIDLPTFCYHSDLSVYGACRLCIVQVEGRGIVASCSTAPEPGMKVKTGTEEIREIRRIAVELLLANHEQACPTCAKSASCQLQALARRLGIEKVRFAPSHPAAAVDVSSPSLVRDPNKCILCGDCVRFCTEIQGVGAIDFTHRGSRVAVQPAFGKELGGGECVNCGQCASVCPTGAITPKSETRAVWRAIEDPKKTVVAQIAPAVRVALGERFNLAPGTVTTGQITAALKAMGVKLVFDTAFTADLTVIEESEEFLARTTKGGKLPLFTSCCPAWVKFAEHHYPDLLPNLSSCRSPQAMFGSLCKDVLPARLGIDEKDLFIVSVMPCTAKKFEAKRPELTRNGRPDVDAVITTQELASMIEEAGIRFDSLAPESLDAPFGFKTGAGVIFGASGGVSEAVLRYAAEKITGTQLDSVDFPAVRNETGLRTVAMKVGGTELRLAVVSGLAAARALVDKVRAGQESYDLIEVMACPGGCIGGAGQPVAKDVDARRARARGLYTADKTLELHKSQENYAVKECYEKTLKNPGSHVAHDLLHTHYQSRKRIIDDGIDLMGSAGRDALEVSVCVGTSCYLRGSQDLLRAMVARLEERNLENAVAMKATFCFERCGRGPTVRVGDTIIEKCTLEKAMSVIDAQLAARGVTAPVAEGASV